MDSIRKLCNLVCFGVVGICGFACALASQATPLFQTGVTYHQHLTGRTVQEHTMDVTFTPGVYVDLGIFFRANIVACSFTFDATHSIPCDTTSSRTVALYCPTCIGGDTDAVSLVPAGFASEDGINYFPDALTCKNSLCFQLITENVFGSSRQFDVQALTSVAAVPEPAPLPLFALGLVVLFASRSLGRSRLDRRNALRPAL